MSVSNLSIASVLVLKNEKGSEWVSDKCKVFFVDLSNYINYMKKLMQTLSCIL